MREYMRYLRRSRLAVPECQKSAVWRRKPSRVDEFPRKRSETEIRRRGLCFENDGITGGMKSKGVLGDGAETAGCI